MHNAVVRAPRPRRPSEEAPARLPTRGPHDAPRAQAGAEGPNFNTETERERAIKAQSERRFLIDLRRGKGQPSVQLQRGSPAPSRWLSALPSFDASVHRPEVVSGVQGHAARRKAVDRATTETEEAEGNKTYLRLPRERASERAGAQTHAAPDELQQLVFGRSGGNANDEVVQIVKNETLIALIRRNAGVVLDACMPAGRVQRQATSSSHARVASARKDDL